MQTSTRGGLVALSLSMLRAGLAMSALVSAVIMATFVVGPFYLFRGLGLEPTWMGLAMAVAPAVAAMAAGLHTTFATAAGLVLLAGVIAGAGTCTQADAEQTNIDKLKS